MQLEELVENSYRLFADYTIGETLQVCKACCVTDEQEKELVNTPLRTISSKLLWTAYYESARNNSDRELWEMKHFLPRVLELVSNFDFPCYSTEVTFTRLDLNESEKWTTQEKQLLADFSVAYFRKCLTFYPYLPNRDSIDSIVVMFGIGYFDLSLILKEWENAENLKSLLLLTDLVLNHIEYRIQEPYKLTNEFSKEFVDKTVISWLNDTAVKSKFSTKIEKQLMANHNLDQETREQLRWTFELVTS